MKKNSIRAHAMEFIKILCRFVGTIRKVETSQYCSSHEIKQTGEVAHVYAIASLAEQNVKTSIFGGCYCRVARFGQRSGDEPKRDEVSAPTRTVTIPGSPLVSFDISWVDPVLGKYYLADRSNKAVDVIDPAHTHTNSNQSSTPGFVGFTGNNDTSGPDGVITVDHKELWVGDGQSRSGFSNPHSGTLSHTYREEQQIQSSPARRAANTTEPMSSATIQMIIW